MTEIFRLTMLTYLTEAIPTVGKVSWLEKLFRSTNFITGTAVVFQQLLVSKRGRDNAPHTTASRERPGSASSTNGLQPGRAGTAHFSLHSYLLEHVGQERVRRFPRSLKAILMRASDGQDTNWKGIWHKHKHSYVRIGCNWHWHQVLKTETADEAQNMRRWQTFFLMKVHLHLGQLSDTNWFAEHILWYGNGKNTSLLWK